MHTDDDQTDETISLEEWARIMRTSLPNAYRQAQAGRIAGLIRIGQRQWRVSRRVVDRQLDGQHPVSAA